MTKENRRKRKIPLRDRVVMGVSITVCIIALLVLVITLVINSSIFSGENGNIINDIGFGNSTKLDAKTQDDFNSIKCENFLVCGLDESEKLTDVIMLVSYNYIDNKINILQIPRDSYIESGVSSTKKINSAYSTGDSSLTPINRLVKVINNQFDLRVDHYVTVDIKSFRNVIDAMGGVPIDIPYDIGNSQLGIIYKGHQVLNGEQAEWLVRHRHTYADQDIGRIKIQRLFLAAAAEQLKTIGVSEVVKMIPSIFGNFTTDLTVNNVKNYAKKTFTIDLSNITFFVAPGEGVTTSNGQSVWTLHKNETADLLNEYFRPFSDKVKASDLGIVELAHTGEYYENTENDIQGLIDGDKPGQKNTSSSLPAYTHVVTMYKPPVTTTKAVYDENEDKEELSEDDEKPVSTDTEVVLGFPAGDESDKNEKDNKQTEENPFDRFVRTTEELKTTTHSQTSHSSETSIKDKKERKMDDSE